MPPLPSIESIRSVTNQALIKYTNIQQKPEITFSPLIKQRNKEIFLAKLFGHKIKEIARITKLTKASIYMICQNQERTNTKLLNQIRSNGFAHLARIHPPTLKARKLPNADNSVD